MEEEMRFKDYEKYMWGGVIFVLILSFIFFPLIISYSVWKLLTTELIEIEYTSS